MIDGIKNNKTSHTTLINNKKVILDTESGKYYLLNEIGTIVWDFIQKDQNLSIDEVCTELSQNFDEQKEVIRKEIETFIEEINKFGLIS